MNDPFELGNRGIYMGEIGGEDLSVLKEKNESLLVANDESARISF